MLRKLFGILLLVLLAPLWIPMLAAGFVAMLAALPFFIGALLLLLVFVWFADE